jgi:hypothetical protein
MPTPTFPLRVLDGSVNGRARVGLDNIWFYDCFSYAAQNTSVWQSVLTTMTVTHSPAGFIGLNAGSSVATGAVANYLTYKHFPIFGGAGLELEVSALFTIAPTGNSLMEIGLFQAATTAAPLDGVLFRFNGATSFLGVSNNNGTEVTVDLGTFPSAAVVHDYKIQVLDELVVFVVDDVPRGSIPLPSTMSGALCNSFAPIHFRNQNTGTVSPTAQVLRIADVRLLVTDVFDARSFGQMAAGYGDMGIQGHAGATMGSTALYTSNLAAGAGAAATNTTAALGSGLGGQFTLQPTLVAATDGIISSYQVPAGTALIPGKSLVITGVWIDSKCTSALTGGPCNFQMALSIGATAVSQATGEAANTKAPRRLPLGWQSFVVTAATGAKSDEGRIYQPFMSPLVCLPGEFVQVLAKNQGTVTSGGTITFMIGFDAHWE